jgi:site-specific DNA-adenine methylase
VGQIKEVYDEVMVMWGYYGSKSKIVGLYPPPIFTKIIEPFAGTAQYALRYWDREVLLIEKYDTIVNLWKWLQKCSPKDILGIRQLRCGESTDNFNWDCQEQKDLVGFIITGAPSMPKKTASKWKTVVRPNTQQFRLESIANNLRKIRHWIIEQGDYTVSTNQEATWFIDPPYMVGGKYYKYGSKDIDYRLLSSWCKERKGQIIVCEASGADWLPFIHLSQSRGNRYQHNEAIWTNYPFMLMPEKKQVELSI